MDPAALLVMSGEDMLDALWRLLQQNTEGNVPRQVKQPLDTKIGHIFALGLHQIIVKEIYNL